MPETFLSTKLRLPPLRPNLVPRSRLFEQLEQGLKGPLTLIAAPAGYGKTTLLSAWRAYNNKSTPFACLLLDEDDNDPERFLRYLVQALESIQVGLASEAARLLQPSEQPGETALTVLVNSLSSYAKDFILALDDLHIITNPAVFEILIFLLTYQPSCLHLVFISRADPPIPLSRLRATGSLVEIRAEHLRFTHEETAIFLRDFMKLQISDEDITTLERRSEGWAAGLQLAALSLQGHNINQVQQFIKDFSGSHHYIVDYLADQVLRQQPPEIHRFLLETSFLERLSEGLCHAITGQQNTKDLLEHLDHSNLFLTPLDEAHQWYRYHPLFGEFLRRCLRNSISSERWVELHLKAAAWCEENTLHQEAVRYALSSGNYALAANLIEKAARKMFEEDQIALFLGWMKALPQEIIFSSIPLVSYYGWSLAHSGYLEQADSLVEWMQQVLGEPAADPIMAKVQASLDEVDLLFTRQVPIPRRLKLSITIDLLRACIHRFDNPPAAIRYCEHALQQIPAFDLVDECVAHFFKGHALLLNGETRTASQVLYRAVNIAERAAHHSVYMSAVNYLVQSLCLEGKLQDAMAVCKQAQQYAHARPDPILGGVEFLRMGELQREWNELDTAEKNLEQGLELAEKAGDFVFLRDIYIAMARLEHAQGAGECALEWLNLVEEVTRRTELERGILPVRPLRTRIWLALGKLEEAARWAAHSGLSAEGELDFRDEYGLLTLARLFTAQGESQSALRILDRLLPFCDDAGRRMRVIEIHILRALALQACGAERDALAAMLEALTLAQKEGYVRLFLDEGEALVNLLRAAARLAPLPVQEYSRRLLSLLMPGVEQKTSPSSLTTAQLPDMVETLTEREIEVLRLIASGSPNKEIAVKLYISIGTVKRHTVNIFRKLNCDNRTQAVALARQIGLL